MARQDRIDSYEAKIKELQRKLKEERARENEQKRKERTQRLIKIGALVEKYAGELTDFPAFEKYLTQYGGYIRKTQGLNQPME